MAAAVARCLAVGSRGWTGLALLLLVAWWLAGLGAAPLFDVDEGAFAEASREMRASGDWGHTTLNGADRFDKPILVYWLQALALALCGDTEFAVRLPSALCAVGWCIAVHRFAAVRWGRAAGIVGAVVLATSVGPLLIGRAATADALLNLLLTLTMLDLWRFFEGRLAPSPGPTERAAGLHALRRAFLWAGLGLLAKGPVAVLLPLGAALLWASLSGGAARAAVVRAAGDARAWALGLAIALPWYAYALARHGRAFVDGFIVRHNLERFAGALEGHGGSWAYYLLVLPLVMLPWTPLLVPLARGARQAWADPAQRFLACWLAFVVVLFSLAGTKLPHYVLYGYTPLVLCCARLLGRGTPGPAITTALLATCALLVLVGAAATAIATQAVARATDPHWRALLDAAAHTPGPSASVAGALLLLLAAALVGALRSRPSTLPLLLLGAGASALWWVLQVVPWWAAALQGPVKSLALEARQRDLPLVQWHLHRPSAGFYRGQAVPRRAPLAGEAALVWATGDAAAAAAAQGQLLRQDGGFALLLGPGTATAR